MKVISLFSGAGGLDLGFVHAGHEIVWANDIDTDAVETYRKNIGDHIFLGDINDMEISNIPNADIVIGGFPCQGFSLANVNKQKEDKRNVLYKQFCKVVKLKKPMYFLAENVRGILSLDNGQAIKKIVSDFTRTGYRVQYKTLNAANYGVPQNRVRVIIIGTRKDLLPEYDYVYPEPTHSKPLDSECEKFSWVSIGEALSKIPEPEAKHVLLNHVCSQYKVTNRNFTGHRRTDPNKPSPTILARGNGKGGVCAIQHPNNHRRISVRESAIVQTFPVDFSFFGKLNSCYRQVGNAVPVLFATKLASQFTQTQLSEASCG